MDWKRLDRARRSAGGPIEVDLVEAYVHGKIKRRDFVKRGTMIGLSVPFMGSIIAACGSDDDSGSGSDSGTDSGGTAAPGTDGGGGGSATTGGDLIAGIQTGDANSGLDPINMLDLGTYCGGLAELRVPRRTRRGRRSRPDGAGDRVESERRRKRLDLQATRGRDVARRQPADLGRCGRHDRTDGRRWCRASRSRRRRRCLCHRVRSSRRPHRGGRTSTRRTGTSRYSCRSTTHSR